ncbi:MAG: PEP-CTERM sorting domain-containing protein [Anaerolineae bacterium]|nr:PEP-CTERM sorting domain-containing protein [Phycisphaerae bacterium]
MAQLRRPRATALALSLATGALVGFVPAITAHGAARTWINSGGGLYDTPANWSTGNLPLPADNAIFNLFSPYTVSFTTPRSITNAVVTGDNTTWNLGGTTYTITAASMLALTVGQNATDIAQLTMQSGTVSAVSGTVGVSASSRGTLSISSGATVNFSSTLNVGSAGFGTLNINNGGAFSAKQCSIAAGAGAAGSVLVSGAGSIFSTNGVNGCIIGNAGAGSFALAPNTSASTTGVTLANLPASSGIASINNASWTNSSGLNIGNFGGATLNLSHGTLTTDQLSLGNEAGSLGVATLAFSSVINCSSSLAVASLGNATVTIDSASTMTAGTAVVAAGSASQGELNINATGSSLSVSGMLTVAGSDGSNGAVNITNGGSLSTGGANVAPSTGSIGTVNLNGAGSRWTCNGPLRVGGNGVMFGSGTVSIGPGASLTVAAAESLHLYLTGAVNLTGGTLSVGSINYAGGLFNFSAGTLIFTGSNFAIAANTALGQTVDLGAGKTVTVTGAATIAQGAMLRTSGGNFSAGSLINSGEILLSSQSSLLSAPIANSGLIHGDGRISGALTNSSGGEVRASSGQRIAFQNDIAGNSNSGSITLFGGIVEFDHLLTTTGRITGRGTLIGHGAISNSGTIALSAGTSDVIGALTNLASGKTIITGGSTSTFFDDVTNIAGSEFRVSTASTAVFLGNVTGLSAFTGPGTKDFEGGASGLMINTTNGSTIVGPDGNLSVGFIRDGSLHVEGAATITPSGSSANVSCVGTLNIAGGAIPVGTLDLNDNDLITTSTPKSLIESQIKFARNGGLRDRAGITSTAAKNRPQHSTTLGVLSGAEYRSIHGPSIAFDGFSVADSDVLVKYTYYGDTDLNGIIDFDDYSRIDAGFNNNRTGWMNGDSDLNGIVDFDDYSLVDLAFNTQSGTLRRAMQFLDGSDRSDRGMNLPSLELVQLHLAQFGETYATSFLHAVPEPTSAAIVLGGLAASAASRRRRSV